MFDGISTNYVTSTQNQANEPHGLDLTGHREVNVKFSVVSASGLQNMPLEETRPNLTIDTDPVGCVMWDGRVHSRNES